MPRMPCSGRSSRGSVSYFGPPTAPSSTASAACASSTVDGGNGWPAVSWPAPPIAPRAFSIGSPSAASTSSTRSASRTISGPMPSPGRIAIFTRRALQPRLLGEMPRLECANLVGVLECPADVVPPVKQAALAERIDVEMERQRAIRVPYGLLLEIDSQRVTRERGDVGEQPVDARVGQHDREQPVLEAVVEKDVRIRRRDQRAEAVIRERPRRVLAR